MIRPGLEPVEAPRNIRGHDEGRMTAAPPSLSGTPREVRERPWTSCSSWRTSPARFARSCFSYLSANSGGRASRRVLPAKPVGVGPASRKAWPSVRR